MPQMLLMAFGLINAFCSQCIILYQSNCLLGLSSNSVKSFVLFVLAKLEVWHFLALVVLSLPLFLQVSKAIYLRKQLRPIDKPVFRSLRFGEAQLHISGIRHKITNQRVSSYLIFWQDIIFS